LPFLVRSPKIPCRMKPLWLMGEEEVVGGGGLFTYATKSLCSPGNLNKVVNFVVNMQYM
jgi:hypothetical protein